MVNIVNLAKEFLKDRMSLHLRAYLRLGIDNYYYSKQFERINNKSYILFGVPIHNNLGDHLITVSEEMFIYDSDNNIHLIEIPKQFFWIHKNKILDKISDEQTIIISGGGWLGNIWGEDDDFCRQIIQSFPNNKIIIFPQTIYFDSNFGKEEYKKYFSIYNCRENLIISLRELNSFNIFAEYVYKNKILLCPDIALYYKKSIKINRKINKRKILGICLRDDIEKVDRDDTKKDLIRYLLTLDYYPYPISTISTFGISKYKQKKAISRKIEQFASCDLIITDRLHGLIFSYLVNTPCIIFDNKTKKVSGVFNTWLKDCDIILPCFSYFDFKYIENFLEFLAQKIKNYHSNNLDIFFENLRSELING